ncbi:ABC transporter ATP-binding protein [Desulfofustis limnaeus]|jgi:ABC-type Fe3+/spermidine/putrescine transport system ATPase subunit|uniref:Spermidine/putrescine ABC transporter ATP-binding protein n=1 Tax=Desulfofustis limnaeus TaxID=2740163 RepID=A0ABN6M7A9_9BACT|nr:ABC transporter ATP-binding protein [Desulfofustis limnaeus]MDX9895188.1 ABC transporter ATP-binding protein [Desulfofustis sp.]BDD88763.1 spermidine/putrescine ABC transporter ATP-binding protein [Desulfofustis limnaeus]
MDRLEVRRLSIGFGDKTVLDGLDLTLHDGELFSLLGPSGAGKSTILKAVAGLLQPMAGSVLINGKPVDHLPPERRDVVLIFQKPLLFPFLSVRQNIAFGLRMIGLHRAEQRSRIDRMIELTGLRGLERRRIHQLSGGQQQRVALARGLVLEPSILLLDEPFSSLDAELREQMRDLIRTIQRRTGTTMLFVTHDQQEAFALSDRIGLLLDGKLRQTGAPAELFYRPADLAVARFFGCQNMVHGRISGGWFYGAPISFPTVLPDSQGAVALIRPEDIVVRPAAAGAGIVGRVSAVRFEGAVSRITVETALGVFTVLSIRPGCETGMRVELSFAVERMHVFLPEDRNHG